MPLLPPIRSRLRPGVAVRAALLAVVEARFVRGTAAEAPLVPLDGSAADRVSPWPAPARDGRSRWGKLCAPFAPVARAGTWSGVRPLGPDSWG